MVKQTNLIVFKTRYEIETLKHALCLAEREEWNEYIMALGNRAYFEKISKKIASRFKDIEVKRHYRHYHYIKKLNKRTKEIWQKRNKERWAVK
jgi:hypothetical protein